MTLVAVACALATQIASFAIVAAEDCAAAGTPSSADLKRSA